MGDSGDFAKAHSSVIASEAALYIDASFHCIYDLFFEFYESVIHQVGSANFLFTFVTFQ